VIKCISFFFKKIIEIVLFSSLPSISALYILCRGFTLYLCPFVLLYFYFLCRLYYRFLLVLISESVHSFCVNMIPISIIILVCHYKSFKGYKFSAFMFKRKEVTFSATYMLMIIFAHLAFLFSSNM